jgi:mono/diheme cytochrome c family protein
MNGIRVICALSLGLTFVVASLAASKPPEPAGRGETLYREICQGCHMPEGEGARGAGVYPALARNPRLVSWEYVAVTVLNGRNAMPPFGLGHAGNAPTLSDAEIADVTNYVRAHFGNRYHDRASADRVAQLPHPGAARDP